MTHKEQDLTELKKLHDLDVKASLEVDIETLISLWSDDGVLLPEGGKPTIGKVAIGKHLQEYKKEADAFEIIEYSQDFEEIKIIGDWAFEWMTFKGAYRMKETGEVIKERARAFRLLHRQSDGSWKAARVMYQNDVP